MNPDHPVSSPVVDTRLDQMNGLQRAVESFRYVVLSIEWWISPNGSLREWLRRNVRVAVWLLIPAIVVMPIVGFIVWQFTGHFIVLGLLLLFVLIFKALLPKR